METPLHSLVADIVAMLDPSLREDYEERAAIMEYEANLERAHAECLALIDLLRRHPSILIDVTILQVELAGAIQYWLTTDLDSARQYLADIGGVERGIPDLAAVIKQQYGNIAVLTTFK
ncbi:hypothetical protein C8R30_12228 [Nitrosomonas nitrosa]|uniref:Uncharacterized protein n=1 Tax=Nitrosomonas nitrosa TaxID=52442 RepID=A0A1I4TMX7_9PROT|nr:hypothetical protein [Nitrosomonas nitrosa]PTQ92605.1 hypothetical protein C8R30_12228 [Nitrosomonas nitrosa]SFM78026.1 hypothetical protein SAMN05421880_13317 [Nitrosomonas nitrosa]